jgi:hypothetical protein
MMFGAVDVVDAVSAAACIVAVVICKAVKTVARRCAVPHAVEALQLWSPLDTVCTAATLS